MHLFPDMARTVLSGVVRRRRGEDVGDRQRREEGRKEGGRQENIGHGEEEAEVWDNVGGDGENQEGEGDGDGGVGVGRRRRERKTTEHFKFGDGHKLFSQIKGKSKQKHVSAEKHRESVGRHYGKKQLIKLKKQVLALNKVVKKQSVQLKKKDRKINSLQKKK